MFSFWIVQLTIWLGSIQLSKYDIVENMWSLIPVLFLPPFQLTDHSSRCKTRKYPHFKARSCETLWLWVCQNDRWVSVGKYNVISQTVFRPNCVVVGYDARQQAGLYEHHNVHMLLCSVLDEEENQLVPCVLLFLHSKQQKWWNAYTKIVPCERSGWL